AFREGARRWRGGEKPVGARASDDADALPRPLPALVVERHDAFLVAAVGRAEVEPPRLDRLAEETLAHERVEDRLEDGAAADHHPVLGGGVSPPLGGGAGRGARGGAGPGEQAP